MAEAILTEDDYIAKAQAALGDLKSSLHQIEQINMKAGRVRAANAVMGIRGRTMELHADALEVLYTHYPEGYGDEVGTRGGGGR
ncbi:hypothetical protein N6L27_03415 [Leisingera sp. SS27]|uniref:hypothetical protein n=1 Tax=Leisingera sp. SS27 TaxID=2979462 RepID=UPI0023304743|nr:hypothetical protein [Leisingera sp. SS27]MDC0657039.1 hypothetical protein [Leisingera sp. SS27]